MKLSSLNYPSDLPCAAIDPYSFNVDMGLIRSAMDGGNTRQRRLYTTMPHVFQLVYRMPYSTLVTWQYWVNRFAYGWFNTKLGSMYSNNGKLAEMHCIRFISNLEVKLMNARPGWFEVSVQAELTGDALANTPRPAGVGAGVSGDWIVGGAPHKPSDAQHVIAGDPHHPQVDHVLAGTPKVPNALIYT